METRTNKHHIINKVDHGTNHPDNIVGNINLKVHRDLHNLFGNLRPHSQIDRLIDISHTAWLEDRLEKISELFDSFNGEYYKPHCIRPVGTKFKKSGNILVPQHYES